jgi:acetylornithine deacetylase/succinyl-diaminopimelate desuccinylase-like protein
MTGPTADDAVARYVDEHADAVFTAEDGLAGWLRIPSISADPAYAGEVRRSAEWLADTLRRTGFPTVEVWETAGLPSVFAQWPSAEPGAPTVLVYGHHDVQPVDPLELWTSPPFEPTIRGDELFARGAVDDKGQVLIHLLGLRAHLAATGRDAPAVNVKVIVEGEEESGSEHFPELLRAHRDRLRCDAVVVSDTSVFDRETPSLCLGMRGIIDCEIDLLGAEVDLHSGSFGGAVPNPATALARLIAALHDDDGRITLPGFYDRVVPLSPRERGLLAELPFDEDRWLRETARAAAPAGEAGYSTLERMWARPTAEVNGMWGGHIGPGRKTVIPAGAHAKLSFRLVHDQRPDEVAAAFEQWLRDRVPTGLTAHIRFSGGGVRPFLTPLDAPALQAATRAMERAFGQRILYTREGGSGPEADIAEILEAPVLFMGVGLPDDRAHAPNERVVLPMLARGSKASAYLWEELASTLR